MHSIKKKKKKNINKKVDIELDYEIIRYKITTNKQQTIEILITTPYNIVKAN